LRYKAWERNCIGQIESWFQSKNQGPPYGAWGKLPTFIPLAGLEPLSPRYPEVSAEEANKDSMRGYHVVRKPGEEPAHAHH